MKIILSLLFLALTLFGRADFDRYVKPDIFLKNLDRLKMLW